MLKYAFMYYLIHYTKVLNYKNGHLILVSIINTNFPTNENMFLCSLLFVFMLQKNLKTFYFHAKTLHLCYYVFKNLLI
jgi:hypothetical protein